MEVACPVDSGSPGTMTTGGCASDPCGVASGGALHSIGGERACARSRDRPADHSHHFPVPDLAERARLTPAFRPGTCPPPPTLVGTHARISIVFVALSSNCRCVTSCFAACHCRCSHPPQRRPESRDSFAKRLQMLLLISSSATGWRLGLLPRLLSHCCGDDRP